MWWAYSFRVEVVRTQKVDLHPAFDFKAHGVIPETGLGKKYKKINISAKWL